MIVSLKCLTNSGHPKTQSKIKCISLSKRRRKGRRGTPGSPTKLKLNTPIYQNMTRVALCGKKYSGKSLAASILTEQYKFTELSFAAPLKEFVISTLHVEPKYCYDPAFKETVIPNLNVSARQLLQTIGTDLFRDTLPTKLPALHINNQSIWVYSMAQKIKYTAGNIVVADLRFEDECAALRELGFVIVRLERPSTATNVDTHISENVNVRADIVIDNSGTVAELENKLQAIVDAPGWLKKEVERVFQPQREVENAYRLK
jgi:hypothetical protein